MVDNIRLFINGIDAYENYGAFLGEKSLITLMTPPPNKAYLENKSSLTNGKEVLITDDLPARVDERDISLTINIKGDNPIDMLKNYKAFCDVLQAGSVNLSTSFEPDVVYHLFYQSCSELQTFFRGFAKFNIKFNEPNPANRV